MVMANTFQSNVKGLLGSLQFLKAYKELEPQRTPILSVLYTQFTHKGPGALPRNDVNLPLSQLLMI